MAAAASDRLPDPLAAFFFSGSRLTNLARDAPRDRPYIEGDGSRGSGRTLGIMTIDDIIENFSFLDDWDDRYRYVIELGRGLSPLPDAARSEANKVQGCASQVWLSTEVKPDGAAGPVLSFVGDSDAHIVRGLIAILFAIYSDRSARDILATDAVAVFEKLGLREHLTPQRSNGFRSMVERIKADAQAALAPAA
jgi:cysteine desulfuration protein SufE